MPITLIFFIVCSLMHATMEDPRLQLVLKRCEQNMAQNVTQFNENYSKVIASMQDGMLENKFATGQAGLRPNRVFVLAQCMEDLSREECETCFTSIKTQIPGCLPHISARVFYDGCFIRVENYSFFRESISRYGYETRCSDAKDIRSQTFKNLVTRMMDKLVQKAPENHGYAEGQEISAGLISAYGMTNCWRTLNESSCSECLTNARIGILKCLPSVEARVLHVGCYLRYSDSEFVNKPDSSSSKDSVFFFLSAIIGSVGICLTAILAGYFVSTTIYAKQFRQHEKQKIEMQMVSDTINRSLQFKYSTLEKATENFTDSHKIGQGGFGEVFQGTLQDGREIAIKHLFLTENTRNQEISNEIDIIGQAHHPNLVRFLGYCFTYTDGYLVYEYLPNKSLDLILFDQERKKELTWKKRLGIITGTAEGLQYMHQDCQVQIIHRDIKASNILLDMKLRPKIADFGLARLNSTDQMEGIPAIAGTFGYMAPEYLVEGRLTEKVDVYSYGVLVLEIISGERNNKYQHDDSLDTLVTMAWKHYQIDKVASIIDSMLGIEAFNEVQRIVEIALLCTQESPDLRPTMGRVVEFLAKKELILPAPTRPPFVQES
ncbi:cysteine-rich receptor-like protein kinase 46 isoform X1 [Primulina eburnea]|uniref:cysteine-rich receptor-like protein kinase 46 isoform X1 n=1 Tax=Primulina eburnea TaxID=1245227 RepID=UPI003C6C0560